MCVCVCEHVCVCERMCERVCERKCVCVRESVCACVCVCVSIKIIMITDHDCKHTSGECRLIHVLYLILSTFLIHYVININTRHYETW